MSAQFGMIGLGTMGRNLVLNIADHGFSVCGFDRSEEQRKRMEAATANRPITTVASSTELVTHLTSPRVIMFLVPAGKIVDAVIEDLLPQLEKGDILIDGGNSHFTDTERRYSTLLNSDIHYIGMGVSGGENGARFGPSLMPGGNRESYTKVKSIVEAIAAKFDNEPCVAFMGKSAAGHYVKMVHNGIEYAMMQMISEVYGLLKANGLSNNELHELFKIWDQGILQSFLIEITAAIFEQKDPETGGDLIDKILDKAEQKGTGLWTSENALEIAVPTPTIDVSVTLRYLSALKDERVQLSKLYPAPKRESGTDIESLKKDGEVALHFGFLMAYAQGLELLEQASTTYNYELSLPTVLKVWRAGCIIRSLLLNDLFEAYTVEPQLKNIMASGIFISTLNTKRNGLVNFLKKNMDMGLPAAALSSALNYFDAYRNGSLPANLIQAQRDFFGAHTYKRVDQEGSFHTDWTSEK